MAKTRNKKRAINEAVIRNPTVDIRSITIEDLLGILQEKSSAGGKSTAAASKEQILEEKIEVLEEELCRKNQMIQSLEEQIETLKTEGNNPAGSMAGTVSDDSFTLEENCGKEVDLNISIDKLLHCKAIAKRRAEELGNENPLDTSNCSLPSDNTDSIAESVPVEEQSRTPKSAAKDQKERRPYKKRKVPASSVRNMSAWLALANKETVDQSAVNAKRKRSEETDKAESVVGPKPNNLSLEENDSSGLKIKSFASQHAKELNVSFSEN